MFSLVSWVKNKDPKTQVVVKELIRQQIRNPQVMSQITVYLSGKDELKSGEKIKYNFLLSVRNFLFFQPLSKILSKIGGENELGTRQ